MYTKLLEYIRDNTSITKFIKKYGYQYIADTYEVLNEPDGHKFYFLRVMIGHKTLGLSIYTVYSNNQNILKQDISHVPIELCKAWEIFKSKKSYDFCFQKL